MTAMYGVLFAVPVIWACAGYVLVSHPGTDEAGVSRANAKLMARPAEWAWPESMALASPAIQAVGEQSHLLGER